MQVKIQMVQQQNVAYGMPRCKNARLACKFFGHEFLTTKELRILELMGFEILVEAPVEKR